MMDGMMGNQKQKEDEEHNISVLQEGAVHSQENNQDNHHCLDSEEETGKERIDYAKEIWIAFCRASQEATEPNGQRVATCQLSALARAALALAVVVVAVARNKEPNHRRRRTKRRKGERRKKKKRKRKRCQKSEMPRSWRVKREGEQQRAQEAETRKVWRQGCATASTT